MSERMRESLSALSDGEASELELERVLSQISGDAELRRSWMRYSAASAVISGQRVALLDRDISGAVRDALAGESAEASATRETLGQRLLRPVASLAVAASVAATVIIGGQQLAGAGVFDSGLADGSRPGAPSPVGMVYSLGAVPVRASYGTEPIPVLQPATRTAYRELARQRMERYMQVHAEHAALNSPEGLLPFARVTEIRE